MGAKNISKYLFFAEDNILLDTWTSLSTSLLVHQSTYLCADLLTTTNLKLCISISLQSQTPTNSI